MLSFLTTSLLTRQGLDENLHDEELLCLDTTTERTTLLGIKPKGCRSLLDGLGLRDRVDRRVVVVRSA